MKERSLHEPKSLDHNMPDDGISRNPTFLVCESFLYVSTHHVVRNRQGAMKRKQKYRDMSEIMYRQKFG